MTDLDSPSNKRAPLFFDDHGRVWTPSSSRRSSMISIKSKTSKRHHSGDSKSKGVEIEEPQCNIAFNQEEVTEVHVGHSPVIKRKSLSYLKKEFEIDYHKVPLNDLYRNFGTNPTLGLNEENITKNSQKYGKNILSPPKQTPLWLKFLKTLIGGLQLLLWTGSIISFMAYAAQKFYDENAPKDSLYLGVVLAIVVLVIGFFTFSQEYSSQKIMEGFKKMMPSFAVVIRNGKIEIINSYDVVVGDIVDIKSGDRIPADIRLIENSGLKVDNSSLTGESEPQPRSTEMTSENPMETKNLAFFSTYAIEGTARGIVVAVGDDTFIGRIAGLTSGLDKLDTPLSRELAYFVKMISAFASLIGLIFFLAAAYLLGYSYLNALTFMIGIIVANVPEGLMVTFTVILAISGKRMAKKNCLVRQLHAVETLGSCSVICSDKTGTLTLNKMRVSHIWCNNTVFDVKRKDRNNISIEDSTFKILGRCASLCSRANFVTNQESIKEIEKRKIIGDASETAILISMEEIIGNVEEFRSRNKKIFEIPFNSVLKYQVSIHEMENDEDNFLLVMKGAPEKLIELCKYIIFDGEKQEIDAEKFELVNGICENFAVCGERVFGFCEAILSNKDFPPGYNFSEDLDESYLKKLCFVGLISMMDPPRQGVPGSIQICRNAGIKVVMVTGDHKTTATSIARSIGIISEGNETLEEVSKRLRLPPEEIDPSEVSAVVVTGDVLMEMTTEELDETLINHKEIIFARVSPQQKLVIVEAFQRQGSIVAVTGDGVNDSPALKKADIGVAMGIAGSDVAKQSSDMILMDDNFISIVAGIEEGRLLFENLKKAICYLLTPNIPELLPFLIFIILRIPLPLGTIPMLMICLGTDILPTITLSYEEAEGDIMKQSPRDPIEEKLVSGRLIIYSYAYIGVIQTFSGMFVYCVVMAQNGFYFSRLIGIADKWYSGAFQDLEDSLGQEWTFSARKNLEISCWTAYFVSILVCQIANVIICKSRRCSSLTRLFSNWYIFGAILFEIGLACLLAYTPGLNDAISYYPIKFSWWFVGLPFFFFIIVFDECRRYVLRNFNIPWFTYEFYF